MQFAKTLVKLEVQAFHIVNVLGFNSVRPFVAALKKFSYS